MPKSEAEGMVEGVTKNRPHERYWFLSSEKKLLFIGGCSRLEGLSGDPFEDIVRGIAL